MVSQSMCEPAPPPLVLASSSAYRRALLERLRLPFTTDRPDIDESPLQDELPEQTARRLARAKAQAVADRHPGALVIGSDQVACCGNRLFGKPGSHAQALEQLRALRGRTAEFLTALCLFDGRSGRFLEDLATVRVTFRDLPDAQLDAYLRAEQPYDCAGSAKSEGLGILLLERIDSDDPTALVGLPLIRLTSLLLAAGYPLLASQPT